MPQPLLFELATEEIPASYQKNLWLDWQKRLPLILDKTGLEYQSLHIFAGTRRIAFVVDSIAESASDVSETLQGPAQSVALTADGKPTPALVGFAKKAGIAPEAVEFVQSAKGVYASATVNRKGATLAQVLPSLLHELVSGFRFPRSMRWSDLPNVYARPIAGYYLRYADKDMVLDNRELQGTVLADIPFRGVRGHFILDKEPIVITITKNYAQILEKYHILVEPTQRREHIARELEAAAAALGLTLVTNNALLDEVNFLVERPSVVAGEFNAEFLRLPDGVILSEMNQHQRYFGLRDQAGKLSNKFLIVAAADTASPAARKNIQSGNERVLRARLSDGAFFFDEDLKRSLESRVEDLKQIVFHDGLGTYREKVDRMGHFAALFSQDSIKKEHLVQAARLAKADLTTQLVYEFDHLQGEIGAVYAARDGIDSAVCEAVREHYQPRFQGDALPASKLGALLSLADKWDNTVAAFLLGKEPTASQDPFAIRRQSLYIIQILVAQKIRLSIAELTRASLKVFEQLKKLDAKQNEDTVEKLLHFFKARLATIFESEGFDKKLTRAAIFTGSDDVYDLFARASALKAITEKDRASFDALITAFKRMAHILKDVAEKPRLNEALFEEDAERELFNFAKSIHNRAKEKYSDPMAHYRAIFEAFAAGKKTVDLFFDRVMVNHENNELRENRQALLTYTLAAIIPLMDLGALA